MVSLVNKYFILFSGALLFKKKIIRAFQLKNSKININKQIKKIFKKGTLRI